MRAVISTVGKDHPGILAYVAKECADRNINIEDVTQKVLQDMFTMIMIVEIPGSHSDFESIAAAMEAAGERENLKIHVMHEDIFNAMHTI
ncbi:MAG: ACT domain-containing protein [Solobacterium sp.]|nr:ACT domain-containing protein [Solobacterium sp.]